MDITWGALTRGRVIYPAPWILNPCLPSWAPCPRLLGYGDGSPLQCESPPLGSASSGRDRGLLSYRPPSTLLPTVVGLCAEEGVQVATLALPPPPLPAALSDHSTSPL